MNEEQDMGEKIHSAARRFSERTNYARKFFSIYRSSDRHFLAEMEGELDNEVTFTVAELSKAVGYSPFCRYTKDIFEIGSSLDKERVQDIGKMVFQAYRWNIKDPDEEFTSLRNAESRKEISDLVRL
jgi:hypothetical protein